MNSHAHKGHYALNVARLPFRHFGTYLPPSLDPLLIEGGVSCQVLMWWAIEDSNLGPLACEASALTAELITLVYSLDRPLRMPVGDDATSYIRDKAHGSAPFMSLRSGNDWDRTSDLALMKRPL